MHRTKYTCNQLLFEKKDFLFMKLSTSCIVKLDLVFIVENTV